MNSLSDVLDLTPAAARLQWRRVMERVPRKRQEAFLPIELVLCMALFRLITPNQWGGANIHKLPDPVNRLARTLVRTPGSLTSKMLNLEGRRKHGGRLETRLFLHLAIRPDQFAALHVIVLDAARAVGLDHEAVPDVLESETELVGQETLSAGNVGQALDEERQEIGDLARYLDAPERQTSRLVEMRIRLGQHRFARQVYANYGHRCAFCGFAPHELIGKGMLRASHIKPWRHATSRERLDPRNGIAACPIHDAAFDAGLLTVNGGLRIHRAPRLDASLAHDEGTPAYFGAPVLRDTLSTPAGGAEPRRRYLEFHKVHVFDNGGG